jgi:hypothetical protein
MSFAQFMQAQCEAIEASGLDPMEWIEQHAEAFRAAHPVTEEEQPCIS